MTRAVHFLSETCQLYQVGPQGEFIRVPNIPQHRLDQGIIPSHGISPHPQYPVSQVGRCLISTRTLQGYDKSPMVVTTALT